jgi:hypothetical protein
MTRIYTDFFTEANEGWERTEGGEFAIVDWGMMVVAHQHLSVNSPAGFLASFPQGLQKRAAVAVILEDGMPLIAVRHQMIDRAWIFDAEASRHEPRSKGLLARSQGQLASI